MNTSTHERFSNERLSAVRVRFAPSPTGYLHIGGARTSLYNWLYAKKMNGTFILRIEDTDEARSTEESVGAILESMNWLGLKWDEGPLNDKLESKGDFGPYFQMQRKEQGIYQKYVDELLRKGFAYPCYCTQEELAEMREQAMANKQNPKYDRRCLNLTEEQRKQKQDQGKQAVIRFKMPDQGNVEINDIIRGNVVFENSMLDDFVIMKANGVPTYNFACVIDDYLMKITHVIRGDDHLSNTPRQINVYKALGWEHPIFAHLSMILGQDGARLSKRHGHTSVIEYKNDGYVPGALVNYLSLLGWSTEESQQLFEIKELIDKFSLERCSKSPATFDPQKLIWMNGEYVRKMPAQELIKLFYDWIKYTKQEDKIKGWDNNLIDKTITLEQEKIKLLQDITGRIDIFFSDDVEYRTDAIEKVLKNETAKLVLEQGKERIRNVENFTSENLEKFARDFAKEKSLKTGQVFHPLRVAVSGRTEGPSLFHMLEILGKEKVIRRIDKCISKFF